MTPIRCSFLKKTSDPAVTDQTPYQKLDAPQSDYRLLRSGFDADQTPNGVYPVRLHLKSFDFLSAWHKRVDVILQLSLGVKAKV